MKHGPILLIALLAGACQGQAPSAPKTEPEEEQRVLRGCAEASRLLGQMKAAESSFRYDAEGNATISTSLWASIPGQMKEGLVKAIAYHAVCEADEPRVQEVTIRSAEGSEILSQETVTEFDR